MKQELVPSPPVPEIIEEKFQKNLDEWINFFRKLSPRIKVYTRNGAGFNDVYDSLEERVRKICRLEDENTISFPEERRVAFFLQYNSSLIAELPKFDDNNFYVFCFYDYAFSLSCFEWDGDGEEDPNNRNYSVHEWGRNANTWNYVTRLIISYLKEIEGAVEKVPKNLPDIPSSK